VSPGDHVVDAPYVYVGPWSSARPGDPRYWNAPFGALLPYGEIARAGDPVGVVVGFLVRGLGMLGA
jgi:hypothetical protein